MITTPVKPLARHLVVAAASTVLALSGGTVFAASAFAATPAPATAGVTAGHASAKTKCSAKPANDPCHLKKKHAKKTQTTTNPAMPAN